MRDQNSGASDVRSRRLILALLACGTGMAFGSLARAQACFDLSQLKASDASLRRTLNFRSVSSDPKRTCGGCAFFTAAQAAPCGKCALFSGGAVSAASVCDSWAAKR